MSNLSAILTKAEAYAAEKKFEPKVLLDARLFPDMFPLIRQVQVAAGFRQERVSTAGRCWSTGV